MIRTVYTGALVVVVVGVIVAAVLAIVVAVQLAQSPGWESVLRLVFLVWFGVLGALLAARSQFTLKLTSAGLQRAGWSGWRLSWAECETVSLTASQLVIKPSAHALQRSSVRSAVLWSRLASLGRYGRDLIVLPGLSMDADAARVLAEHGIQPSEIAAR